MIVDQMPGERDVKKSGSGTSVSLASYILLSYPLRHQMHMRSCSNRYSSLALFFYNGFSGSTIGVAWRPSAFKPQRFGVAHAAYSRVHDQMLLPNLDEVVHDFKALGGGLVSSIDVLRTAV